jgi:hypothetical protein
MRLAFQRVLRWVAWGGFAAWVVPALAQSDAEMFNQLDRVPHTQLEAVCARMSPSSYASGLTDGAWGALPLGGRTYFYKSYCYQELARRTRQMAVCQKVKERHSLLGDGSAVSQKYCETLVQAAMVSDAQQTAQADRHAAAVRGAFKITRATVTPHASGDWLISVHLEGSLPGNYRLEIESLRERKLLVEEAAAYDTGRDASWLIRRDEVTPGLTLPAIVPLGIRLYYVLPAGSGYSNERYLSSIQNVTLSVQ